MWTTIAATGRCPDLPLFLREKPRGPAPVKPADDPSGQTDADSGETLLCRACRAVITTAGQAVSRNERHEHTFFNPAGIIYEIRCFAAAPGCRVHGRPTGEFTWFPGYTWQYALCATCGDHLGWYFSSGESGFFGLISPKLIA